MESIVRSTIAAGAMLAISLSAFFPGAASAATRSTSDDTVAFAGATSFVAQPDDGMQKMVVHCGPGSPAPFNPCDEVKRFCALLGGDYEPGACHTPTVPPPSPD